MQLVDQATSSVLDSQSGARRGRVTTSWVTPSNGNLAVSFASNASGLTSYQGAVVEGYEYQRYQTGAQAFWIPLGFPGQYYDAETDLFENWNRYYESGVGRCLQPEPVVSEWPVNLPSYSYALDNPLIYQDETGFGSRRFLARRMRKEIVKIFELVPNVRRKFLWHETVEEVEAYSRAVGDVPDMLTGNNMAKALSKDVAECGGGGVEFHRDPRGNHCHARSNRGHGHVWVGCGIKMWVPIIVLMPFSEREWRDFLDPADWLLPVGFEPGEAY
ncbi:RHS repeat domain-containing protein [Corallococcus sp. 4LFB]|uniref:RHS repeat domain-containing protein n=1 Tax=Corallococcus sp. 4LFB TaxID=3383249 RepID=UPI0039751CDA